MARIVNYTMIILALAFAVVAPVTALSNARSASVANTEEQAAAGGAASEVFEHHGDSAFVQVGRVGAGGTAATAAAKPAAAPSPVVMTPDGMDLDYPVAQRTGTRQNAYSNEYLFPADSMTGQLARFIFAAGFLFAEMLLIFGVLALLEYFLIWWKPQSFGGDIHGRITTRPANPANRFGSLLTTPNLHQRVEEHNQERIRLLEESQKVQCYDGKTDAIPVSKESPAAAA